MIPFILILVCYIIKSTTLTFHNIIYFIQSYSFVKKIRLLVDLFFLFYNIKQKVLT